MAAPRWTPVIPALATCAALVPAQQGAEWLPARERPLRFAVIGDYGEAGIPERDVAVLVHSWAPEFVITTGDNNYPDGAAATIDQNVGQFYRDFIRPYYGAFGSGSPDVNRFFPTLGNHDWVAPGAQPYLGYFTLPGNERYYELAWGPVHLFALDSDAKEPDGVSATSPQALWLQGALAASPAPFKLVYLHHPPYSSGRHGSTGYTQWPFEEWGASAVLAGHDHDYERLLLGGMSYFVNGLGGGGIYPFGETSGGSEVRFDADYGAMLGEATARLLRLQFVSRRGNVVDTCELPAGGLPVPASSLLWPGAVWKYLDDGSDQGVAWRDPWFDDSAWAAGPAELGYGDGDEATVVGYGPNANDKYITTYFRHAFVVANPALYRELHLRLLRDDGAVVHLNGVEVSRTNMPSGAIDYRTLASFAVAGYSESTFYDLEVDPALLLAGTNVLAVEIHQSSPTSSDISFNLGLVGVAGGTVVVPRGALWHYLDDGSDPGVAWRGLRFNDAGWAIGPAQLGYGEGDEATVVSYGPDPGNKYITTYFRHAFTVTSPAAVRALLLSLLRDDGAAVYLNGVEVHRADLPFGWVRSSTLAPDAVAGADENVFIRTSVDPGLLRAGTNVLAVEVHQTSPTSSDLSFDLELEAYQ